MTNDFNTDLQYSHQTDELPFWEKVYRAAFPTFATMNTHRQHGYQQNAGVDRSITLQCSKVIRVDEKVRRKAFKDILLEYVSNDRTNAAGWVCKPLLADYIAYAILPIGFCYLLPVLQLQKAWLANREDWLARFGTRAAQNKGYATLNCPVPPGDLVGAMINELRFRFEPIQIVSTPAPQAQVVNGSSSHWDAEKGHFVW